MNLPYIPPLEEMISLNEARKLFWKRRGKQICLATIHRFADVGRAGPILRTWKTPSGRRTTAQAVRNFLAEHNRDAPTAPDPAAPPPRANYAERQRAAAAILDGAKI